jgi:hypothetical protein
MGKVGLGACAQDTILGYKNASEGGLWWNSFCQIFKISNNFEKNIAETHS